jgi:hypothetical protein
MKRAHRGALLVLWGARVVCIRDIFILNEIRAQGKIHILTGTLVEIFYLSFCTGTGSELKSAHVFNG